MKGIIFILNSFDPDYFSKPFEILGIVGQQCRDAIDLHAVATLA